MLLLDCNRNFHQNLYYFGLLSTDCLRISQSGRLRFTTNQFWTLFIEGVAPSIQRCRYTLARSFMIGFSLYAECSLFWVTSTTRRTYFLKMFGVFHFGFSHFEVRSISHQIELQRFLNWVKTHSGKHQLNSYSWKITQSRRYNQPGSRV